MVEGSLSRTVGRQWELRCAVARRDRVTPSVCFSIPARRPSFCPDRGLGSSNRPFPRRRPRSNGSAREPPGPDVALGGETAVE
jgi:hypothetical protein